MKLARAFNRNYQVYFDQVDTIDFQWGGQIRDELLAADFVIILLSPAALASEVMEAQVEIAHGLASDPNKQVRLLPILLGLNTPLPAPFNTYLNEINWAYWQDPQDTERLIETLQSALAGQQLPLDAQAKAQLLQQTTRSGSPAPSAPTALIEMPEGTMPPDSHFYIERDGDRIGQHAIRRNGVTVTIKGPRQVGKSSLLIRLKSSAELLGKQVVLLDFQLFKSVLNDADAFFRLFCRLLSFQLRLPDETEAIWSFPLPNPFRASEYVAQHILPHLDKQLVLAMDEVETVFSAEFRTDFFGMLRSWHNNRSYDPIWKKLDLTLVTSTEPYFFIDNLNQSPFNVGEVIALKPFTVKQTADLNQRHGCPLSTNDVQRLHLLLNGHPYLTRRALYLLVNQRHTAVDLFACAIDDDGPFGDHLRSLMLRLHERSDLLPALQAIITQQRCDDQHTLFRLRGAGLIRRQNGKTVPANQLYADFLRKQFDV